VLADEVAAMFAEFDGYDRYEREIEVWARRSRHEKLERSAHYRSLPGARKRAVQASLEWKRRNPERARAHAIAQWERFKRERPEAYRLKQKRKRESAAHKEYRIKNADKVREWNRKHQAARRARLKAMKVAA